MAGSGPLPLQEPRVVDKPWGREDWLFVGERVAMKRILVRAGCRFSLQRHELKEEGWLIVSGRARVHFEGVDGEMRPGDVLHIRPGQVHRLEALEDVVFVEASTTELTDVVRIEDDFGR